MTSKQATSAGGKTGQFDWQGHRGCRGLMPENSIPAFLEALKYPVTTLEMDVVISRDNAVIVSHEPWMNNVICTGPGGETISEKEAKHHNIYQLTLDEIRNFDCGSNGNPQFRQQQKLPTTKPTLAEVVYAVDRYCKENNRAAPDFNIELKSTKAWYDTYVPQPEIFVSRVLDELKELHIAKRTTLQSFDIAVLQEIRRQAGNTVAVSYLIDRNISIEEATELLGFYPEVYSPYFLLVNENAIAYARDHNMRVIPWTVNDAGLFQKLIALGVDGIITDYPDLIGKDQ